MYNLRLNDKSKNNHISKTVTLDSELVVQKLHFPKYLE